MQMGHLPLSSSPMSRMRLPCAPQSSMSLTFRARWRMLQYRKLPTCCIIYVLLPL